MTNKLYEKTKKYIKQNYKSLLIFLILFILLTLKLPYYISAPGGIINIKDKIKSPKFTPTGSLNMAYVAQIDGTIPMLLYALVNPYWDIEKEKDITVGKETIEDEEYRNKKLLEEANNIATLVAYNHSNIKYTTENHKIFVTYVDDKAKTNLKIGDQIISIDDKKITEKQDLYDAIENKKPSEKIKIKVIRDNKEKEANATLIKVSNQAKVGIIITETMDIKSKKKVKLNFKETESGSSGGLMLSLTIYSYLNKIDLTNGKKIVGTGTIDINGNVGQISGIKYKLIGAVNKKADLFLVPYGKNYKQAKKIKEKEGYNIKIVPVKTFDDALNYLTK